MEWLSAWIVLSTLWYIIVFTTASVICMQWSPLKILLFRKATFDLGWLAVHLLAFMQVTLDYLEVSTAQLLLIFTLLMLFWTARLRLGRWWQQLCRWNMNKVKHVDMKWFEVTRTLPCAYGKVLERSCTHTTSCCLSLSLMNLQMQGFQKALPSPIKSQAQPVFAKILSNFRQDIGALPGVSRWGTSSVVDFLRQPVADGLSSVLLFGVPDKVNSPASTALHNAQPYGTDSGLYNRK